MWLLLVGVVFALSNFGLQLMKFYSGSGEQVSCSGVLISNPFMTPCFFGAMFFLISFIVSVVIVRKNISNKASELVGDDAENDENNY